MIASQKIKSIKKYHESKVNIYLRMWINLATKDKNLLPTKHTKKTKKRKDFLLFFFSYNSCVSWAISFYLSFMKITKLWQLRQLLLVWKLQLRLVFLLLRQTLSVF